MHTTLRIMTLDISIECHYAEFYYAECRYASAIMLTSVFMPSFIMLSIIMLSFIMLSVIICLLLCVSQFLTVMLSFHYADCCYAVCHNFFLLCWVSLCWMLLCWVLWRRGKPLVEWRENKILKTIFGLSWKQFPHRGTKNRLV